MPASDVDYRHALSEFIKIQVKILGPDIVYSRLAQVHGIRYNSSGEITNFLMDPLQAFQQVISLYTPLSPMVVKQSVKKVLEKYPLIKVNLEDEL